VSSRGNDIMRKYEAVSALKEQSDAVRALGVTSLYLFGSMVRDSTTSTRDLDLFIDYDRNSRFSLIELVGIKQLLEQRLGIPVDVTIRDSLDPPTACEDRGFRRAHLLIPELIRPALRAILEAIEGRTSSSSWRAKARHPRLCCRHREKTWMPTPAFAWGRLCVGMTMVVRPLQHLEHLFRGGS
jgi:predicted nucleotidyltransferase